MGLTGGSGLTDGVHASVSGERRQRYPFGFARCWASGRFFGWAESVPVAFYSFFFDFLLVFLFLFSVFISILFKIGPN
jgi:hypothetical protein